MALIECPECLKEISSKAPTCPHCGASAKKKTSLFTWLVAGIFIFGAYVALTDSSKKSSVSKPAFSVKDTSPTAQKKRNKLISNLIDQGIFQKVSMPGSLPRIHVWPKFHALSADDKKLFAGVVLARYWVNDPKIDMVIFYDARTDKKIGTYSPTIGGLDLD